MSFYRNYSSVLKLFLGLCFILLATVQCWVLLKKEMNLCHTKCTDYFTEVWTLSAGPSGRSV
jgi:hypothetical protein